MTGLTVVPLAPDPVAVAVLRMEPASRSAWVMGFVAVQVSWSPGARLPPRAGLQASADSPARLSLSCTFETVTLPLLVMT